ncbi:MAG: NAD(P)H-quinone oxidoreductase [Sterolibacterium sp.]|jgi:NADPH2:quinone reductase|nr:NAD(P)H-quinone oxidoreductase [Sterolibacterium sp.]MBP9798893.1 NAD(P)H-quinone oxidoreductase [Sterolibacterium sp.]
MKFIQHATDGRIESMRLADGLAPQPAAGDILIEVSYAGVNRPDLLQRAGLYPPPPDASPILGLEVAGRVAALGSGVKGWQVGDRVAALTPGGGYAEYCLAAADHALPVAAGVDLAIAAALPEAWFTVWANLVELGRLRQGERLLIHGGSSGIGLAALELARHLGVETFVTVGNAEKAAFCRAFGAHHVIEYRQEDFLERIRDLTAGEGVDVVLDMVGGDYLQKDIRALRHDGRLLMIAFLAGSKTSFDFMPVMMKRLTLTGSTMRARSRAEKTTLRNALQETVWPKLMSGALKTHLAARYPLAQAADAHRLMESSQHIGKIVLQVSTAGDREGMSA